MKYTTLLLSTLVCAGIVHKTNSQRTLPPGAFVLWKPPGTSRDKFVASFGYAPQTFQILQKKVPELKDLMAEFHNKQLGIKKATVTNYTVNFDDIFLSLSQVKRLIKAYTEAIEGKRKSRRKRKILDFSQHPSELWDVSKKIIYVIDGSYKEKYQEKIVAAIKHWEDNTCIKFERKFSTDTINEDHIVFLDEGSCSSHLGKDTEQKPQSIFLSSDVCFPFTAVGIHEIGHALGFLHEQMRLGASKYIDLDLSSIWPDTANTRLQFQEWVEGFQTDFGVPYDFGSVMHYSPFAFSSGSDKVIIAKNLLFQPTMGQRLELSFLDIKVANLAYNCQSKCPGPSACGNGGGIVDSNNCAKCICPDGLGGTTCTKVDEDHSSGCSTPQEVDVTSSEKCIQTPKYGSGKYPIGAECNWHLKAPGSKIQFYFKDDFGIYCTSDDKICHHWVEIKYKGVVKSDKPGPRFCCDTRPTHTLVSDGSIVVVSFRSIDDAKEAKQSSRKGFKLCFKRDDGSGGTDTTTEKTTTVTTTTKKTTTTEETTTTKTTTIGPSGDCMHLVCNTMSEWEIKTKPSVPTKKLKAAFKGCKKQLKVKSKKIEIILSKLAPSGNLRKFNMEKVCVKAVGSATRQVDLRGPGGSTFTTVQFPNGKDCLLPDDFKDIKKIEEITLIIKKGSAKVMKVSDLEVKVCM